MDAVWVVLIIGGLLALYILPSLIAAGRHTEMILVILVLNLLLGWTILGWFVALALAMLLPPLAATAATPGPTTTEPGAPAASGASAVGLPPAREGEFQIDPMRVAALSLFAPIVYQYWWLWRFFKLARRERFPRARSFWWILVPLYGYAVIGRLFHDLQSRLGPERPQAFNAQVALGLIVAANVSAGWGVRMSSIPFLVGGLALSCVFTAMALYQVQVGINAYLRQTYVGDPQSGLFPGEIIAVVAGLAALGLLVLGSSQLPTRQAPQLAAISVAGPSAAPTNASPPVTVTPSPITPSDFVLKMTSEPGDFVGQGRATTMTKPAWRLLPNVSSGPDSVSVSFETIDTTNFARWTVELAAPKGQALHPGTYLNATRAAFRAAGSPGIDVFGDGRGCNNVYGSFSVTKVTMDPQGAVQGFEATFEQHCEQPTAPALRGYVRFGIAASDQQARLETRSLG